MSVEHEILTRHGKRFVLVPLREYRHLTRLAEQELSELPQPGGRGNYPAVAAVTVSIARDIITRRRAAGLSQRQLAKQAGVRTETINRLESAKHVPRIPTVQKIDRALTEAERQTQVKQTKPKTRRRKAKQ